MWTHFIQVFACVLIGARWAASASHLEGVEDLVVFGDSYTDNCNTWRYLYATEDEARRYPFPHCPAAPTGRAGGLYTWLDYVERLLQPSTTVRNFAQGAATCDNDIFDLRPFLDVGQQIELLRTGYNTTEPTLRLGANPATQWAALFIGTNDIGFFTAPADVAKEVQCVRRRLESLLRFGYRNLVLFETINLENTPLHSSRHAEGNVTTREYVRSNREAQAKMVHSLNEEWRGNNARIHIFPTYSLFSGFTESPGRFGYTNVTAECIGAFKPGYPETCADPEHYLWFDSLHPSFHAHRLLADEFLHFLKKVSQ